MTRIFNDKNHKTRNQDTAGNLRNQGTAEQQENQKRHNKKKKTAKKRRRNRKRENEEKKGHRKKTGFENFHVLQ